MSVIALTTGAREGDARKPGHLARLLRQRKLPPTYISSLQVHDTRIFIPSARRAHALNGYDGFLTDLPDQPLVVFTADCAPIFVSARDGDVVGVLHAGWRGVRGQILREAARSLRRRWGIRASEIQAWTGPHIGPCCFEVQWDVARYFPRTRRQIGNGWRVNLEAELKAQALALGVRWGRKKGFRGCTMHESRFHSYRRNKTPMRQASIILKRKSP